MTIWTTFSTYSGLCGVVYCVGVVHVIVMVHICAYKHVLTYHDDVDYVSHVLRYLLCSLLHRHSPHHSSTSACNETMLTASYHVLSTCAELLVAEDFRLLFGVIYVCMTPSNSLRSCATRSGPLVLAKHATRVLHASVSLHGTTYTPFLCVSWHAMLC
jgi:hypothetical protein